MEDYKTGDEIWIYDFCFISIEKGVILECHEAEACAYVSFKNEMHHMVDKKYIAPRNKEGKEKLKKIALQRVEKELEYVEKKYKKNIKRLNCLMEELSKK